jgi:hypothetical protein
MNRREFLKNVGVVGTVVILDKFLRAVETPQIPAEGIRDPYEGKDIILYYKSSKASEILKPGITYQIIHRWDNASGLNETFIDGRQVIDDLNLVRIEDADDGWGSKMIFGNSLSTVIAPTEQGTVLMGFTPRDELEARKCDSFYLDDVAVFNTHKDADARVGLPSREQIFRFFGRLLRVRS